MSNDKSEKKPGQPSGVPLQRDNVADLSFNIDHLRKSYDREQNTIRNTHPAPGNPDRDQGAGTKDDK